MYIETVPNRNSPPAVLLRESYRDGGKIKKRTLLNLSAWPAEQVEGLRIVLKGGTALPPGQIPSPLHGRCPTAMSPPSWARSTTPASTGSSAPKVTGHAILSWQ